MTASFAVSNTGGREGVDIVPVYVHRPVDAGGVLTPSQRLVGFARVDLTAGQHKPVSVSLPQSELAVTPGDIDGIGAPKVQPGSYQVQVGNDSASFTLP